MPMAQTAERGGASAPPRKRLAKVPGKQPSIPLPVDGGRAAKGN